MDTRAMKEVLDRYPRDVLLQIGLPHIQFYSLGSRLEALCPFHADRKLGNFGYNTAKDCWRCFVCGKGGSGPYSLIMEVRHWSFSETVQYLYEHRNDCPGSIIAAPPAGLIKKRGPKRTTPSVSIAPIFREAQDDEEEVPEFHPDPSPAVKDAVWSCFAAASPLTKDLRTYLSDVREEEDTACFFRFPSNRDRDLMERFKELLSGSSIPGLYGQLLGVPGFFWDMSIGRTSFIGYEGALGILSHDVDGAVNGIELRLMEDGDGPRYMPFSSEGICQSHPDRYIFGAKLGTVVDVLRPAAATKGVAVTEGKFKALHLARMGYLTLNIRGVGNWRAVLPVLDQLAGKGFDASRVTIVFDADLRLNLPVTAHAAAFGQALLKQGRDVRYLTWPRSCGKGIDDVIVAGERGKIREVDAMRFLRTTLLPVLEREQKRRVLDGRLSAV